MPITEPPVPPYFHRLLASFPGGVAYLDAGMVFVFCNEIQASYFLRKPDEVVGQKLRDVVQNSPDFCRAVERVAATGEQDAQTALSITWPDAPEGEHHFLVRYIADLNADGQVQGVFIAQSEVTPALLGQDEANRILTERNKVLEGMVVERDLLVGIISHEIRTPLTTIFGNAHLLLRRLEDLDEDARTQAINDIRTDAERLNRLVENMLLLARAGAQAPVPTEAVLLDTAIGAAVSEHRARFERRSVVVSIKPPALRIEAQPDYFGQVLQNLLANAEKYSPEDKQIDVRARRHGEDVTISILDHGFGVDPAEAEIIFQPFYRSGNTSASIPGSGIGLAVCKLLVQAQSGHIRTRPRRGGGSVFAFTLRAVS